MDREIARLSRGRETDVTEFNVLREMRGKRSIRLIAFIWMLRNDREIHLAFLYVSVSDIRLYKCACSREMIAFFFNFDYYRL